MDNLKASVDFIEKAKLFSSEKNYSRAIENYDCAFKVLVSVLISDHDEIAVEEFRNEVKEQIKFCLRQIAQLNSLLEGENAQKPSSKSDSDSKQEEPTIICEKPSTRFSDICGLEKAKKFLEAAVVLPVKFPDTFTTKRSLIRSVLFYGPPGAGKTFLAEAVAGEASATFFSVSASDLTLKQIKKLFEVARLRKPSIIFLDDIDSLMTSTDKTRGIKTELFVQLQGVTGDNSEVFIMAATHTPFNLDKAFLRRFDELVYVCPPNNVSRAKMFKMMLLNGDDNPKGLQENDFISLSKITKGLTGSDIRTICKMGKMRPISRMQKSTHFAKNVVKTEENDVYRPCNADDERAIPMNLLQVPMGSKLLIPRPTLDDIIEQAKLARRLTDHRYLEKLQKFAEEKGCSHYEEKDEITFDNEKNEKSWCDPCYISCFCPVWTRMFD